MTSLILQTTARALFHTILVFSLFLLFAGHNNPGGGFIGGLVAAAAIVLRYLAHGPDDARHKRALLDRASKRVIAGKSLTDYDDFARGVMRCIEDTIDRHGVPVGMLQAVVHGTTLATNALIQRRGARTGLIVTKGFRDALRLYA